MDRDSAKEDQDVASEVGKIVTVVADIADDEKLDVGKVGGLAARVASFLIHCFGCNNPAKTPVVLRKDSVEVRRCRNAYQVTGVCSKCGRGATGFIPSTAASAFDVKPDPVPAEERAKRLAEKRKRKLLAEAEDESPDTEAAAPKKRRVRVKKAKLAQSAKVDVLAVDGAIVPAPVAVEPTESKQ